MAELRGSTDEFIIFDIESNGVSPLHFRDLVLLVPGGIKVLLPHFGAVKLRIVVDDRHVRIGGGAAIDRRQVFAGEDDEFYAGHAVWLVPAGVRADVRELGWWQLPSGCTPEVAHLMTGHGMGGMVYPTRRSAELLGVI